MLTYCTSFFVYLGRELDRDGRAKIRQEMRSQQDVVAGSTNAEIQRSNGRAWVSASQGILLWAHPAQLLKNSHIRSPKWPVFHHLS